MTKFRVLAGSHRKAGVTYRSGDIVETEANLLKFNRGGRKFARVSEEEAFADPVAEATDATTATEPNDGLEAMSEDELREFANSNGIKLTGKEKAKQLVAKIREAME
jgi:hypothetical protein